MRLLMLGLTVSSVVATASAGQAQTEPVKSPPPQPVYAVPAPPAPPPPPPRPSGKERPARPTANPGSWMSENDYPAESMRLGEEGTTAFRLTIDKAGKVSDCSIRVSSGYDRLDQTACRLLKERGSFSPALDVKGKPTIGYFSNRFVWVLPKERTAKAISPISVKQSFIVETDGRITNCAISFNGQAVPLGQSENPCAENGPAKPFLDASGKPERRRVTIGIEVKVDEAEAVPAPAGYSPAVPAAQKKP